MAKAIPDEIKKRFLDFCRERFADEDLHGAFSLQDFEPFQAEGEGGEPAWEFHAANYAPDTFDIHELFGSVQPEFAVEVHGYDDFYVVSGEEAGLGQPSA